MLSCEVDRWLDSGKVGEDDSWVTLTTRNVFGVFAMGESEKYRKKITQL